MAWFIAGFIGLRVLCVAFLVLLVTRIAAGRGRWDGATEILRRRFASGEITEEQFSRLREALDS